MHKTLLRHKDDAIAFFNEELEEAIEEEDLEEAYMAIMGLKCIAKMVHADHDIKMDHHEMMKDHHAKSGNPHNPTSAPQVAYPHGMSTIDGAHQHGIASFTVGQ